MNNYGNLFTTYILRACLWPVIYTGKVANLLQKVKIDPHENIVEGIYNAKISITVM